MLQVIDESFPRGSSGPRLSEAAGVRQAQRYSFAGAEALARSGAAKGHASSQFGFQLPRLHEEGYRCENVDGEIRLFDPQNRQLGVTSVLPPVVGYAIDEGVSAETPRVRDAAVGSRAEDEWWPTILETGRSCGSFSG